MRISRLDLTRYGIFTDYSIALGARPTDGPDLHIIYGPNETGKSTALAAFLDLLFGIEPRSQYGFLHPYPTMRVGGEIEINGTSRQFVRIKRPQNSLLDGADKPISEGIILGDLGGIDRGSYATMFSLDDDTLEAGGESILASNGDLGHLLFSASAGLSDLSEKLVELRAELDRFYKFRSRGGELSELKARLSDLKKEREAIDTIASEHIKLVEEHDRVAAQYDEAIAERGRIQFQMEGFRRQVLAWPRLVALRGLRDRIRPLTEIPDAPIGWVGELPKLQREEIELTTREKGVELEIETISEELTGIVADDRALALAERIDILADLRARYLTADKDIPERRLQQRDADIAIAAILARMECDPDIDPGTLLLGTSTTGALRDLMEQHSGIVAGVEATAGELTEAQRRLADTQSKLKDTGGEAQLEAPFAVSQLAAALSLARADDHAARRRLAERMRLEQLATLAEHMRALHPWTGEAEQLRNLSVPDVDSIERWKISIAETAKRGERQDEEVERLLIDQRRLATEIEAAGQVTGILSNQQAADLRAAREEAWASHKRALEPESAETFEACLRRDDIVTNSRIGNAAEVAHLNQISKTLATVNAGLTAARDNRHATAEKLGNIQRQIAAAILEMAPSLQKDWSLLKLEAWLGSRSKALDSLSAAEKTEREARNAEEDGQRIRRNLVDAASAAAIDFASDANAEALILLVQTAIDQEGELTALRSEVSERKRDLDGRERKAQKAREAERAWNESWTELCASCWLGRNRAIPPVATIREVLKALEELAPLIERRASLIDRIQKMASDQRRFETESEALAKSLEIKSASQPLDLAVLITKTLEGARVAEAARGASSARLKGAEARKKILTDEKEIHERRKVEMIDHFKVDSLREVDAKLRDLEKRQDLQNQAGAAEQDILGGLGAPSISVAEEILDNLDRSAVETEIAQLKGRFEDQDKRSRELFSEQSNASDRLVAIGGDDAVAKIEARRRTTLLEIEEGAKRYLCLGLGIAAAEQALRIYRDQHRSSMMARASGAFKIISCDAYKGLTTQPNGERETLVAVGANDGSKIASDLSKGTRFQLYLALRVAGYQEFAQSRRSVPFIADDIMETFDDFRAEEAFKLFSEMSGAGQVIYLTHHRHLCDIARSVCPSVRVHSLPT